ncbi:MAG: glycosyltransferase [Bryobacteraceae bacterium]|nr:glycosyltransferase [Bryobacteraceae bacterium]
MERATGAGSGRRPAILHVMWGFETGGAEMRLVRLANAMRGRFRHWIAPISGRSSATALFEPGVDWELAEVPRRATPLGFARLIRRLRPALVQTYNWGAFDAAVGAVLARVPLLHTEDGFGADEAAGPKARRVWARRLVLPFAARVAVPSVTLERLALDVYRLPRSKVLRIPNGVDCSRFRPGENMALRRELGIAEDEFVAGTVGHLRPEKNYGFLLRAFAEAAIPSSRLVIAGEGPERARLRALARELGLEGRVLFPGVVDPAPWYRMFDLFVMSSLTEQMPLALLEAMASGLPALCTDAGDTSGMLASPDLPAIVPPGDLESYVRALRQWASERELRRAAGARNRERAVREYSMAAMVERWRALYDECLSGR